MAHPDQVFIFVSRTGIDVYTNTGEMTWQGLGGDAKAIGKGRELREFDRILFLY